MRHLALLLLLTLPSCGLLTAASAQTAQRLYSEGKITREEYEQLTGGSWVNILTQLGIYAGGGYAVYAGAVARIMAKRGPVAPQTERQRRALELYDEEQKRIEEKAARKAAKPVA